MWYKEGKSFYKIYEEKKVFYIYVIRIWFFIKNDKKFNNDWIYGLFRKEFVFDRGRGYNEKKYGYFVILVLKF